MATQEIEVSKIRTDGGTQPRVEMNLFTVDEYAKEMAEGVAFPPVTVFFDGEYYWLADGFHRLAAANQAEFKTIEAEVIQGSRRDAVLFSVGANADHGLKRTAADRRHAVETLLLNPTVSINLETGKPWNNCEIARWCKVDEKTVRRLKDALSEIYTSALPKYSDDERAFVHPKTGEVTTMRTANIGSPAIVPEARDLLRDTDIVEDRRELSLLKHMEPQQQIKVASLIASGEALGVRDAQRCITYDHVHEMTLAESVSGKYAIVYADPPWNYSNSGMNGAAENHYQTMLTDDICALPVADLTTSNAVLFLWATNPLLEDAMRVVKAWGFDYKTNFVWVKDRSTYGKIGFYNFGKHELLLVCVKGSFLPAKGSLVPSLIEEPRQEHSRKPDSVYSLIESMYPNLSYLELFARGEARDGWKVWGNQAEVQSGG